MNELEDINPIEKKNKKKKESIQDLLNRISVLETRINELEIKAIKPPIQMSRSELINKGLPYR